MLIANVTLYRRSRRHTPLDELRSPLLYAVELGLGLGLVPRYNALQTVRGNENEKNTQFCPLQAMAPSLFCRVFNGTAVFTFNEPAHDLRYYNRCD